MKVTVLLLALAGALTFAADNAVIAPQSTASHKPLATTYGAEAITIPQMLSYQGKLTDTLGGPVPNGDNSVVFRLYTVPSGGSPFWSEAQSVITREGLFSVLLGSVTPIDSVTDAGGLYLGMAVGGGAELVPRLRIASAAYAYLTARAGNADLLQGKDTTAFDVRYVNEAQTNSVTGAMLVNGTVLTADVGDTAVTMAKIAQAGAATGQVVKWTGSAWAPGSDNTGGGSGVTNVYQDTGIVCVPNPITSSGNVKLDLSYGDGRYVNVTGDSLTGALRVQGDLRVYGKGRIGPSNSNSGTAAFVAGFANSALGNYSTIAGGQADSASGVCSGALSGYHNKAGFGASDSGATVAGGGHNTVTAAWCFVGGGYGNTAGYGHTTIGGGRQNCAMDYYATVGGGIQDTASGTYSTVSGGYKNKATVDAATVSGGMENVATGSYSTVAGGLLNRSIGSYSVIGGGLYNEALATSPTIAGGYADTVHAEFGTVGGGCGNLAGFGAYDTGATVAGGGYNKVLGKWSLIGGGTGNTVSSAYATIGGGYQNSASSQYTTVGGGVQDTASGTYSTVGGGYRNKAAVDAATVSGGYGNIAGGSYSMVGGGLSNRSSGSYSVVCGGMQNAAFAMCPTVAGGYADTVKADHGAVGGGYRNRAGDAAVDTATVISGGWNNIATGKFNSIGGGYQNSSSDNYSTVGGGRGNAASGPQASVLGGWGNTASGYHSVAAGGLENVASGTASTVSGGEDNLANGYWSSIAGGRNDTCQADYALLSGYNVRARANADYSLAFGENCSTSVPRAVVFYHSGAATKLGVGVQTPTHNIDVQGGAYCNGTNWVNGSSRKLKTDISALTREQMQAVLAELERTQVVKYRYKSETSGEQHIGLIAEDAPELLATPERDGINTADAIGFLMAALKAQQAEIEQLRVELAKLGQ